MSEATTRLRIAVVDRALHGPGISSVQLRRAAFDNRSVDGRAAALVDTVARNAWKVTDEQVADTLAAGVCEEVVLRARGVRGARPVEPAAVCRAGRARRGDRCIASSPDATRESRDEARQFWIRGHPLKIKALFAMIRLMSGPRYPTSSRRCPIAPTFSAVRWATCSRRPCADRRRGRSASAS